MHVPTLLSVALLLTTAPVAQAQESVESPSPVPALQSPSSDDRQTADQTPSSAQPARIDARLGDGELAALNGREGSTVVALSDQDLVALNHGNSIVADQVGSGGITLGSGAFTGFSGIGNFVINSGHNNNLQGAITINVVQP